MALTIPAPTDVARYLEPPQTLRASTALLRKIKSDQENKVATEKPSLLADADDEVGGDDVPLWLVLTTKKHIVDKKRLKPGKIVLPHPYLNLSDPSLRICLITADPQRKYKDLIAHPSFPLDISQKISRVIGLTKLKAKYKSFESRRQLLGEHDVFLADDRIITYLPTVLGKTFYKGGSKRPVPINLEGKRQNFDEQGNKRRKLSEGGTKVTKSEIKPIDFAKEIERALSSALVHLAPSTTTSVKIGKSSMQPEQVKENVEAVTDALVEKYVPQKWPNVRAVHIKGPSTAALPLYMAEELWEDEKDVLEEAPPVNVGKKRKASALTSGAEASVEVIEVPGPDGKMRRLERSVVKATVPAGKVAKKRKSEADGDSKAAERVEAAARKAALEKQKKVAKASVNSSVGAAKAVEAKTPTVKPARKVRAKAADLI